MRVGSLMSNGFEEIYLLQNAMTIEVVEVFEVYSYTVGLKEGRYSFASAIGFFQSLVGMIMVLFSNWMAKRTGGNTLW
jgi:putative aldouronate transport system permease protein